MEEGLEDDVRRGHVEVEVDELRREAGQDDDEDLEQHLAVFDGLLRRGRGDGLIEQRQTLLHVAREVLLDRTQVSAPTHDTRHTTHGTRHTAHDTRHTRTRKVP